MTTIGDKSRVDHESLVQVVSSTGEYNIKGPDSTLFPKTPHFPSQWATYDANALRSALDISKPFVSKDLTRIHLRAALVEIAPTKSQLSAPTATGLPRLSPPTHVVVTPTKFWFIWRRSTICLIDARLSPKRANTPTEASRSAYRATLFFWKGKEPDSTLFNTR